MSTIKCIKLFIMIVIEILKMHICFLCPPQFYPFIWMAFYSSLPLISAFQPLWNSFPSILSHFSRIHPRDHSPQGSSDYGILQQEYWRGSPFPSQGIFLAQGFNPHLLGLLHWQVGSLPPTLPGKPTIHTRLLPIPSDKLSVDLFSDLTPV